MDAIIQSIIGGTIPAIVMVVVHFMTTEKRLTRIETDISWLKRMMPGCNRTPEKDDQ